MQELTDDQLDGLFRKSAEEFEPTFDPAAWQSMQSKLDAHDGTAGKPAILGRLLRWGLPGLLLFLSGVVWYVLQNDVPATPAARPIATNRPNAAGSGTSPVGRPSARQPAPAAKITSVDGQQIAAAQRSTSDPDPLVSARKNQPIDQPAATTPVGAGQPKNSSRLSADKIADLNAAGNQSQPLTATVSTRRGNTYQAVTENRARRTSRRSADALAGRTVRPQMPETPAFGSGIPESQAGGTLSTPAAPSPSERFALPMVNALAMRPMQWPQLKLSTDQVAPVAHPTDVPEVATTPQQKGLSIRAVVSPDLSGIGLRNFSKPGTNVGLMLEYRFARRWSGQIGVLHSTKIYRAKGDEYEWPPYNIFGPAPATVDGRCNMLDVPINLRYDFIIRSRPDGLTTRWFVSGGATSYVMLREDYKYNYSNPNNPHIKYRDWSTKTGPYGFSQLNMSAGYEHPFSRRLSGQLEPFIKAPLRGVGAYRYNLLSTGAFVSIRYRL
ncbi:hypothetical protein [Fibrisoma montanum]|nr:hypothetical protein [Fibrisoma montanum]